MNRWWIFLIAAVVGALLGTQLPAHSISVQNNVITLSETEMKQCEVGGGCVVVTREKLWKLIHEQAQKMAGGCTDKT